MSNRPAASVVLALVLLGWAARADTVSGTRSELLVERAHTVRVRLYDDHAELVVRRTVFNGGDRHDQALFWIDVPPSAVATGLRTLGTFAGRPHWFAGELMEAEAAAKKYRELTGIGGYYPKDPALLSWRTQNLLALQVFPCPPGAEKTIEYTLRVPTTYRGGAHHVEVPRLGTDALGATLTLEAGHPGDRLLVDGKPFPSGGRIVPKGPETRTDPWDLAMLPNEPDLLAGELVTVPFAERRVLTRYAVRTAPSLGSTPRGAFIAVVVDGSRSTSEGFSGAVRAAVEAYLSHFADARVEVITFDRKTHPRYGRFTPAGRVRADFAGWDPKRQNGSDVDRALFEADRLLAGTRPLAPRRILLVTDGLTRQGLTAERLRGATGASGAIVHLGLLSEGMPSLSRDDGHPWAAAARPSGGLLWRAAAGDGTVDEARRVFEEWARPLRLDHVQLFSPDLHLGEDEEPAAPLDEGESIERLVVTNRVASWIRVEGELWSRPVQTTLVSNPARNPLWAGLVFGSPLLDELDEHEMMPLAQLGGAVSPVTSYLAIEPGVRPSTEGLENGEGVAFGFGGAPKIRLGATAVSGQMPPLDRWAFLQDAFRSGLAQCGGTPGSATVSLETTNVEVVAAQAHVTQSDPLVERCLEEIAWNLTLPIQFTEPWNTWSLEV